MVQTLWNLASSTSTARLRVLSGVREPGQSGFEALGEIVAGTVNPSGKTSDTFVADLTATPTWNNFGYFKYDNMDEYAYTSNNFKTGEEETALPSFVNYVDGIYVGYRFYETAAA